MSTRQLLQKLGFRVLGLILCFYFNFYLPCNSFSFSVFLFILCFAFYSTVLHTAMKEPLQEHRHEHRDRSDLFLRAWSNTKYTFMHLYNITSLTIRNVYLRPRIVFSFFRYDLVNYKSRQFLLNCSHAILC